MKKIYLIILLVTISGSALFAQACCSGGAALSGNIVAIHLIEVY